MKLHFFTAIFVLLLTLLTSAYSATNHSMTTAVNSTSTSLSPVDSITSIKNETDSLDRPTQLRYFKDLPTKCKPLQRTKPECAEVNLKRLVTNLDQYFTEFATLNDAFKVQINAFAGYNSSGREDQILTSNDTIKSMNELHNEIDKVRKDIFLLSFSQPEDLASGNLAEAFFREITKNFNSKFDDLYKTIENGIRAEESRQLVMGIIDNLLILLRKMMRNCFDRYMITKKDFSYGLIPINNICVPSDDKLAAYEEGFFAKTDKKMKDEVIQAIKEAVESYTESNMKAVAEANEEEKEFLKQDFEKQLRVLLKDANDEMIETVKDLLDEKLPYETLSAE